MTREQMLARHEHVRKLYRSGRPVQEIREITGMSDIHRLIDYTDMDERHFSKMQMLSENDPKRRLIKLLVEVMQPLRRTRCGVNIPGSIQIIDRCNDEFIRQRARKFYSRTNTR
jgi:hypothetical protein